MQRYKFSSNAWGYYHVRESLTTESIAARICGLGFDGFDLLCGVDAVPGCTVDDPDSRFVDIKRSAEEAGGAIASFVLVSLDLGNEEEAVRQFQRAVPLAKILGTPLVHTLPRKNGITQDTGFEALERVWSKAGAALIDAGLTVTAENHTFAFSPDDDPFLIRTEADFLRMIEATSGQVKVKFDPAFLSKAEVAEDPIPAFERLLPHIGLLDLKDCKDSKFVQPGTGSVDFAALAGLLPRTNVRAMSVEAEHHHFRENTLTDIDEIDRIHVVDLNYYRGVFGG